MLVGMSILGCTPGFVPPEHRIEMLASLEAGIDQLFDNSLGMQSGDISHNPPSWETQAVLLATLRYMKKRFKQGGPSDALSQRAISLDQVRILQPLAGKASIASVDGYDRPVLCEWINYDLHTMDLGPASMFARVGAIVHNFSMEPPPADFNVLHCRGYFHDLAEARFGMLFDYPLSAQPANIPPVALRVMMKQQPRPSLECLFRLAQSLVKSLHCFHRANWLHKNISSHNVLFFSDTQEVAAGNISHDEHGSSINVSGYPTPYLVGFNHSRPSDPTAFTRGRWVLIRATCTPSTLSYRSRGSGAAMITTASACSSWRLGYGSPFRNPDYSRLILKVLSPRCCRLSGETRRFPCWDL